MMHHSLYGSLVGQEALGALVDPSLAAKDTTFTKIFVGGLPYHTSDDTLREYFDQFGDIEEAVVITDRQTQKSRGYGFVTMKDRAGAERACKDPNPIIDGRKANVNLAYLGAKPRGNVQLAGLQLPLQTAALTSPLLQARLGMPQLYYPSASPLFTQAGLLPYAQLAAAQSASGAAGQQLLDYGAAFANQQAAYDPYGYGAAAAAYGMMPANGFGQTQTAAAAAVLAAQQQQQQDAAARLQ